MTLRHLTRRSIRRHCWFGVQVAILLLLCVCSSCCSGTDRDTDNFKVNVLAPKTKPRKSNLKNDQKMSATALVTEFSAASPLKLPELAQDLASVMLQEISNQINMLRTADGHQRENRSQGQGWPWRSFVLTFAKFFENDAEMSKRLQNSIEVLNAFDVGKPTHARRAHSTSSQVVSEQLLDVNISVNNGNVDNISVNNGNVDNISVNNGNVDNVTTRGGVFTDTQSGCGGTRLLTSETGVITDGSDASSQYQTDTECRWTVEPPGAASIVVYVTRLQTESTYDTITFSSDWQLATYSGTLGGSLDCEGNVDSCRDTLSPTTALWFASPLYIAFSSDSSVTFNGFSLEYTASDLAPPQPPARGGVANATHSGCSSLRYMTASSGVITDGSGDESDYLKDMHCKWTVAPDDHSMTVIDVTITQLSVQASHDCELDSLRLMSDWQSLRYCGHLADDTSQCVGTPCVSDTAVTTTMRFAAPLTVEFVTDSNRHGGGFMLEWTASTAAAPNMLPISAQVRSALVDLYTSMGGPDWEDSNGWRDHANVLNSPCTWAKLKCELMRDAEFNVELRITELLLQDNNLQGSVPASLASITSLEVLNVGSNNITALPSTIGALRSLRQLYVFQNQLTTMPDSVGDLGLLNTLIIYNNRLTSLPSTIGNLASLQLLNAYGNRLARLPASIGALQKLTGLHVYKNRLTELPSSLGDLAGLTTMSVARNRLTSLPSTIGSLQSLKFLTAAYNKLTTLPASIGDLTQLTYLDLTSNRLTQLPRSIGSLSSLRLFNCQINRLTALPETIGSLKSLHSFDCDMNQLTELPSSLGEMTALKHWTCTRNQITQLPTSIGLLTSCLEISLTDNRLTALPSTMGSLTSLNYLYLKGNRLTKLPATITNLAELSVLHAPNNALTELPTDIGSLKSLRKLNVFGNKLRSLPTSIGGLTDLRTLILYTNEIAELPSTISALTSLQDLRVYANRLTTLDIPDIPTLKIVQAHENRIERLRFVARSAANSASRGTLSEATGNADANSGSNPREEEGPDDPPNESLLLPSIEELLLHRNNLVTIPTEIWQLTTLSQLDLSHNGLAITLPTAIRNFRNLVTLGLEANALTSIPSQLGELTNLVHLGLRGNHISGTLPASLAGMYNLQSVDVSDNRFSGTVPDDIVGEYSRAAKLDLSRNNFTGALPTGVQHAPLLSTILASHNPWSVPLRDFVHPLLLRFQSVHNSYFLGSCDMRPLLQGQLLYGRWQPCLSITIIEIDNASVTGDVPFEFISINETQVLSLKDNPKLVGSLPEASAEVDLDTDLSQTRTVPPPLWRSVDFSGCVGLNGSVPTSWERITTLKLVNVTNTSMRGAPTMKDGTPWLSSFVTVSGGTRTYSAARATRSKRPVVCPQLGNDRGLQLEADPEYYNWALCTCLTGDVGGGGD